MPQNDSKMCVSFSLVDCDVLLMLLFVRCSNTLGRQGSGCHFPILKEHKKELIELNNSRWFQICFIFIPGERIQFDEHIFQMGWFNHQLAHPGWFRMYPDPLPSESIQNIIRLHHLEFPQSFCIISVISQRRGHSRDFMLPFWSQFV